MSVSSVGTNSSFETLPIVESVKVDSKASGDGERRPITISITPAEYREMLEKEGKTFSGKLPKTIKLTDDQAETLLFKRFGLNIEQAKQRLNAKNPVGANDVNPFDKVDTTGDNILTYNKTKGRYEHTYSIEKSLYNELAGTAEKINKQIKDEKVQAGTSSPNEQNSVRNGIDNTANQRAEINKKYNETVNLNDLAKKAQVLNLSEFGLPTDPNELKTFYVTLPNIPNMSDEGKALRTLIGNNYGHLNLSYQNEIAELAKDAGVKVQNLQQVGNLHKFQLSVADVLKLKIVAVSVFEKANGVEKIYRDALDNNHLSSFIRGVATGSFNSISGTVGIVADLPGTMNALWQVVSSPRETFNALYNELGETWDEFKNAPSEKKAEMVGELVGTAVTEFLLGKGIGKAAGILAKTKTGLELIEKAKSLKLVAATKFAEKFSDEAAKLASQRIKQSVANPKLYAGIPADVLLNLAVVAGNKVKNGVKNFAEFQKQMIAEFGEKVKPELRKLYDEAVEKVYGKRRTVETHDILGGHTDTKHINKSVAWLRQRLADEPKIPFASTFKNAEVANRAELKFIKEFSKEADEWTKNGDIKEWVFEKSFDTGEDLGTVVGRGKFGIRKTTVATVRIIRDETEKGWHIVTSFPSPK